MFKKLKRYWYNFTHPAIGQIWELHQVVPAELQPATNREYIITPERLEQLITSYRRKGFSFVSMDEVCRRVEQGRSCISKFIAITLDDGFLDNYEVAEPIFNKYNVPFCIYVTSGFILKECYPHNDASFLAMSPEQVATLANNPLCTIGVHTMHHLPLGRQTMDRQFLELQGCKTLLEQWIAKPVQHLATPYGSYNLETIQCAPKLGFISHVRAWGGPVRRGMNTFELPRIIVEENRMKQ